MIISSGLPYRTQQIASNKINGKTFRKINDPRYKILEKTT